MKGLKDQARRGFTILVTVMLLTAVVVPAFSGSAAATSDGDHCIETAFTQLVGNVCEWATDADTENVSSDREDAYVQADLHAELRGQHESSEQIRTVFDNYAQDTGTIASLEARNAIATAYENNESASTADAKAQSAIQDYYSKKQINTLEAYSKQQAQLAYTVNSTRAHPGAIDEFAYIQETGSYQTTYVTLTGNLVNRTYTLANGTTHTYKAAEYKRDADGMGSPDYHSINITKLENSDTYTFGGAYYVDTNGMVNVRASYAGTNYSISDGHPAQVIVQHNSWASTLAEWKSQSNTVESNYAAGTASDLYTAMDDGRLDPQDVRGAEGQVRYLSGDSNATSQRYKAALFGVLDMKQVGYNSTFYVEYTGYTQSYYNTSTDGQRTLEYSGHVDNKSYQGIVFSSEVPDGGFQPGNTYNMSKLNGTTMIYSQDSGSVTFVKGNLTIQKITDQEGNEQTNVTWEDPKYDTNNVSEYVDYLDKTQEMQMQLLELYSDDTSSGSTTSDSGGWNPTQNQMIAAFIAIVAMLGMAQRGAE